MKPDFEKLIEKRWSFLEGKQDPEYWYWTKEDDGGWSGPLNDWIHRHSQIWFKYIKKYDLCIQAGGNHGLYPALLSRKFKYVYTFEPDALNFHCLVNNCQQENIIKINAALGDCHKMIKMHGTEFRCNAGAMRIAENFDNCFIPQLCIDDFDFPSCDFICLDVEDYEIHVLKGAINTIGKFKPVISAENGHREVHDFLTDLGYQQKEISGADHLFVHRG